MLHVSKERNSLESFTQTHFVSQDSIDVVLIESNHPVETSDLVISHLSSLDIGRTLIKLNDVCLGLVEVRQQLLVLLLLRHPVTTVSNLPLRNFLLTSCLHLQWRCRLVSSHKVRE